MVDNWYILTSHLCVIYLCGTLWQKVLSNNLARSRIRYTHMKTMVSLDNTTTIASIAARNITYIVSKFSGILKPTVSVHISSVAKTLTDTKSNFTIMTNRDIVVRRLYVTIACMIVLTILLLCVDWLLKRKRKILKLRGRLKCLSQDQQHILPAYKTPRRISEAPNRFNGLFVFNMSNTSN